MTQLAQPKLFLWLTLCVSFSLFTHFYPKSCPIWPQFDQVRNSFASFTGYFYEWQPKCVLNVTRAIGDPKAKHANNKL